MKATPFPAFIKQMEGYYPALAAHRANVLHDDDPVFCEACNYSMTRVSDRARYIAKTIRRP